jgi:molecular chaperone Hsp33
MNNFITKILALNKQARILFAENTDLIHEVCSNQNTNKLLKTLLARTVSCASLLTGLLKDNHRISLKVSASKRDYRVYADVDAEGNVRGFISDDLLNAFNEETNPFTIDQIIGDRGCIQVTNDIGMNSIITGITDMPYKNITDDISHYYAQSEQTPTWISTYIVFNEQDQIELSRAVLVQLLPGSPITLLHQIRRRITDNKPVFLNATNKGIMKELPFTIFDDAEFLETKPIQLYCGCSKEMFYSMLYALGKEEISNAYISGNTIEFACNVCGNKYLYHPEELKYFL